MKISEFQVQGLISYLTTIIAYCPPGNDCTLTMNATAVSNIKDLLETIHHQQSQELKEVE